MSPEAVVSSDEAEAEYPPPVTVAQARGDQSIPTPPVVSYTAPPTPAASHVAPPDPAPYAPVIQQVAAVANAAAKFDELYGVAVCDSPQEYATAVGKALGDLLPGKEIEDALTVGGALIFGRIQTLYGLTEDEVYELTERAIMTACGALTAQILSKKIANEELKARSDYRREAILTAVGAIFRATGRGATVASIQSRLGRRVWTEHLVKSVLASLTSEGKLSVIAPQGGPGRKSVRYILRDS